jgi:hypothetical protein
MMSVIEALEASSIPYMLVGSFSSNVYGVERSTQDADFVIELIDQTIGELARRLAPLIRVDRQLSFETVTMTKRFVANVADSPFQIEFFLLLTAARRRSTTYTLSSACSKNEWIRCGFCRNRSTAR